MAPAPRRVEVPEIPILDSPAFKAAKREPDPKPAVEIRRGAEAAAAARPAQACRRRQEGREQPTDDKPPKERIADANARAPASSPPRTATSTPSRSIPTPRARSTSSMPPSTRSPTSRLEPGEKLVSVSAGDTVRWVVGDTSSGEGKDATSPHPGEADRRRPRDQPRHHHGPAHLSPGDALLGSDLHGLGVVDLSGLRADRAQEAAHRGRQRRGGDCRRRRQSSSSLRFRYRIEGDAPWKPRQVFDDGAKVYIQFPSGLAQSEAPPLFVIGPDGKPRARQLPRARHHLHRRPPVRRRRAAARHGAAARRAHHPHRCGVAGDAAMTDAAIPAIPDHGPRRRPRRSSLRARPQPVTRINRKVLIGGAAVMLLCHLAASCWWP